jgi:hypothetical protein
MGTALDAQKLSYAGKPLSSRPVVAYKGLCKGVMHR